MQCPNKKHKDWIANVSLLGETGAYQHFVENGYNLVRANRPTKEKLSLDLQSKSTALARYVNSNPNAGMSILEARFGDKYVESTLKPFLSRIESLTGASIKLVTNDEMRSYNTKRGSNYATSGVYDAETNTVYLNADHATIGTAVHEAFAHPFLIVLKDENPGLYNVLTSRAKEMPGVDSEIRSRGYSDEMIDSGVEHFAYVLEQHFNNSMNGSKADESLLNRMKNALNEYFKRLGVFIKDLFGLNTIPSMSDNISFGQLADIIRYSNTEYFSEKFRSLTSTEKLDARIPDHKHTTLEAVKKAFDTNNENMVYEDTEHRYTNISNAKDYISVTRHKALQLLGDDYDMSHLKPEDKSKYDELFGFSSILGTALHGFAESVFKGETFDNSKFGARIHTDVQNHLRKILGKYTEKYEFVAAEQKVYDHETGVAGTIDLLLRNKKTGKLLQLDIKTKASNYTYADGSKAFKNDKSNFAYYTSQKFEYSDHDRHFFQQWAYKRMQELLGIQIETVGIIPIEINVNIDANNNLTITGANLSEHLTLTDDLYHELSPYATKQSMKIRNVVDTMFDLDKSSLEPEFQTDVLERLHTVAKEGIAMLEKKASQLSVDDRKGEATLLVEKLDELTTDFKNPLSTIYSIVAKANELLIPYVEAYKQIDAKEAGGDSVWVLQTMARWKNYADSFAPFLAAVEREYESNMKQKFTEMAGFDAHEFDNLIKTTNRYISLLSGAYASKGIKPMLDALEPHSNVTKRRFWDNARREYQKNFVEKQKRDSNLVYSEDDARKFADDYVERYKDNIAAETRKFLEEQAKLADTDVSMIYRWADNIFRTKDPLIGAMSKYFFKSFSENERNMRDLHADISGIMDAFDKKYPSSSFAQTKDVYDFMIEHDAAGHAYFVIDKSMEFHKAFAEFKEELDDNESLTVSEKHEKIQKWLNREAPITAETLKAIDAERMEAINRALSDGLLSEEEHKILVENEGEDGAHIMTLMNQEIINRNAAFHLFDKFDAITFKLRQPNAAKYKNDKYHALMALDETDPKRMLYDKMMELQKENNLVSPERYKIGNRLPGIMKSTGERVRDGQGLIRTTSNYFKDKYTVRADDDTRGDIYMLGNELNKSLDTIPIHYTRQLEGEDQSYDIPTIMYEWTKSVSYRTSINKILPELEFVKYIVNNREVKTQRFGKDVRNALDTAFIRTAKRAASEESYITKKGGNLADQLNDWFTMHVYKNTDKYLGSIGSFDIAKALRAMQNMTSTKVMGLNVLSGINNALMAEVSQVVEISAGKIMDYKTYHKATNEYRKQLGGVMSDIGKRQFESKINLALEYFGVFDHMAELNASDKSRFKRIFGESFLHTTTLMGEHEAQGRFLIGALMSKEVFDKDGKSLGNMWDNIVIKDNKLTLNPEIDGNHGDLMDQVTRKVLMASWDMHGVYHQFASNALSKNAVTSMLQQFRKWYIPGMQRRFDREHYSEFQDDMRYGYIRGGASHYHKKMVLAGMNIKKALGYAINESKMNDLIIQSRWDMMKDHEREAVTKAKAEALIYLSLLGLGLIASLAYDDEDRKNSSAFEKFVMNNILYQMYRLRLEMQSYVNPVDTMQMAQSPIPATGLLDGYLGVMYQLANDMISLGTTGDVERYKAGKHNKDSKMFWKLVNQIPVVRQAYRFANADESLTALAR